MLFMSDNILYDSIEFYNSISAYNQISMLTRKLSPFHNCSAKQCDENPFR